MNAIDRSPFHFEVEDVYLSSGFSGKIVSCTEGGKGALAANVDRASTWETIVPEPQADGTVAFRSKVSNLYISVVDGTDRLVPSVSWIREWEKFRAEVEKGLADGSIDRAAVQASAVRILNATLNGMKHGLRADLWELFDIYPYGHFDGGFVLRSRKKGKFVTGDESSGNRLAAICDGNPRSCEVFSFLTP